MKAVLTKAYACAPEGHTVIKYEVGTTLEGRLAELAILDGAAIEVGAPVPTLENKASKVSDKKTASSKKSRK